MGATGFEKPEAGAGQGIDVSAALKVQVEDLSDELQTAFCVFDTGAAAADLRALVDPLAAALVDEPPLLARDGGFVAAGFDAGLDKQCALRDESRRVIAGLQARYSEETGIKALKIKHNAVLGYHIDVPAAHGEKPSTPPHNRPFYSSPDPGQFGALFHAGSGGSGRADFARPRAARWAWNWKYINGWSRKPAG